MDLEDLKKKLSTPCGRTIGHGENCTRGWECSACSEKRKAAAAIESLQAKVAELEGMAVVAVFEGYVDGLPTIKWTGEKLPAGAKLCATPNPE